MIANGAIIDEGFWPVLFLIISFRDRRPPHDLWDSSLIVIDDLLELLFPHVVRVEKLYMIHGVLRFIGNCLRYNLMQKANLIDWSICFTQLHTDHGNTVTWILNICDSTYRMVPVVGRLDSVTGMQSQNISKYGSKVDFVNLPVQHLNLNKSIQWYLQTLHWTSDTKARSSGVFQCSLNYAKLAEHHIMVIISTVIPLTICSQKQSNQMKKENYKSA